MMQTKPRQPRLYLQLSNAAINAALAAVDTFNRVHGDYKTETTLMLLSNAWELLAKAVLVKQKNSIWKDKYKKETISCEKAINRLLEKKQIDNDQAYLLQQIVSLRNQCTHDVLPEVPEAIQQHLLFFGCKFFKDLFTKHFRDTEKILERNYPAMSFTHMTTYAAQVQKLVSKLRRGSPSGQELVWLLERGVRYVDNETYISQSDFQKLYKEKRKIMPHLKVGNYIDNAEMVCIVPIQAPKNFTADINLRKGPNNLKGSLPLTIKKTKIEDDYQFLTRDIAKLIGKSTNFVAKAMSDLNLKGNEEYHQSIRTSQNSKVQRYSQSALSFLQKYIKNNPGYNPYKTKEM